MEVLPLCNQGDEWAGLQLPQGVSDAIMSLCFLFCCLLMWALFSPWWDSWPWATPGSSKSGTRMKGAEQWLVQLRSHAHHWIHHYGQKKVALLLVYLMWPWEPQRLSKEHTWLTGSLHQEVVLPKERKNSNQFRERSCGDPKIPIRCQPQNPASIVWLSLLSDMPSNSGSSFLSQRQWFRKEKAGEWLILCRSRSWHNAD